MSSLLLDTSLSYPICKRPSLSFFFSYSGSSYWHIGGKTSLPHALSYKRSCFESANIRKDRQKYFQSGAGISIFKILTRLEYYSLNIFFFRDYVMEWRWSFKMKQRLRITDIVFRSSKIRTMNSHCSMEDLQGLGRPPTIEQGLSNYSPWANLVYLMFLYSLQAENSS